MNMRKLLFLDLELATDGDKEIVQIGLVETDLNYTSLRDGNYLCKPKNSPISEYFLDLTKLDKDKIQSAYPIEQVINTVKKTFGIENKTVISWGNDGYILEKELASKGVEFKIKEHINFANLYRILSGSEKSISLDDAANKLYGRDVELLNRHDAVFDAYILKNVFKYYFRRYNASK